MKTKLLFLYCIAMVTACFAAEFSSENRSRGELTQLNFELAQLTEAERTLPRKEAEILIPRIESVRREIKRFENDRKLDPDAGGQPH